MLVIHFTADGMKIGRQKGCIAASAPLFRPNGSHWTRAHGNSTSGSRGWILRGAKAGHFQSGATSGGRRVSAARCIGERLDIYDRARNRGRGDPRRVLCLMASGARWSCGACKAVERQWCGPRAQRKERVGENGTTQSKDRLGRGDRGTARGVEAENGTKRIGCAGGERSGVGVRGLSEIPELDSSAQLACAPLAGISDNYMGLGALMPLKSQVAASDVLALASGQKAAAFWLWYQTKAKSKIWPGFFLSGWKIHWQAGAQGKAKPGQAKAKWFGSARDFTGPKPPQAGPKPRPSGQAKAKTSLVAAVAKFKCCPS
ncbi:hypothetical protein B0H17DRAFT_1142398 [Mycena rosella]|uniref:Uncharacterized protein n=1 Tax=Mycena rosella TaxID=1033263 RepID=A0AAD7G923_MYCRO|nr:hypothetical protein B0H17DRAFT_1142398 [Mycena rosella]